MLALFKGLVQFLSSIADLFRDRQLIDAGKAVQANEATKEVERHVEQANEAVAVPDPVRDERLRNRFDRSRGGK